MTVSAKIWNLYLDELKEIAVLDRAYYLTKDPTTEARREYFKRQQRLEVLRMELHTASRTRVSAETHLVKTAELAAVEAPAVSKAGRRS